MRVAFCAPLALVLIVSSGVAADRVSAEDGRIVLENSSGQKTELTQGGFDSEPWISPDGRTVVFIRRSAEDQFQTSVYEIDLPARTLKVLFAGPAKYQGHERAYFGRPEFNESHDTLFLLGKEYATSGSLISMQLATGQTTFISDEVVGYDVMQCPKKNRGDLIALKRHEQDIVDRPFFLYYLYSSAGQELGLAGGGELDSELDSFRDGSCEEPGAQRRPPVPPRR